MDWRPDAVSHWAPRSPRSAALCCDEESVLDWQDDKTGAMSILGVAGGRGEGGGGNESFSLSLAHPLSRRFCVPLGSGSPGLTLLAAWPSPIASSARTLLCWALTTESFFSLLAQLSHAQRGLLGGTA